MNAYIYIKNTEDVTPLECIIDLVKKDTTDITIVTESRRSFRELEKTKNIMENDDILIIYDVTSLGLNEVDIANQLNWFIAKSICLVISTVDTTYNFGISQPMNKAILSTLLQSILNNNKNIIQLPENRRKNSGRNKTAYPDDWEELYNSWINKEISSKEFLDKTGLKKATFYNLLTDYKATLQELKDIQDQYKLS